MQDLCAVKETQRNSSVMVRAGNVALGCTKRSRTCKSRARTHGFRLRMRTPAGRRVIKQRQAKGRKWLVPQTNPNSGKGRGSDDRRKQSNVAAVNGVGRLDRKCQETDTNEYMGSVLYGAGHR